MPDVQAVQLLQLLLLANAGIPNHAFDHGKSHSAMHVHVHVIHGYPWSKRINAVGPAALTTLTWTPLARRCALKRSLAIQVPIASS